MMNQNDIPESVIKGMTPNSVTPPWIPAFAGTTQLYS